VDMDPPPVLYYKHVQGNPDIPPSPDGAGH